MLGRDIPVIPVLVRGANMPTANQLPKELESLPERHYFELSDRRWSRDVVDLIAYLEKILDGKTSPNDSDSLTEARSAARSLGGKRGITERRPTADPHKVSRTRRVWPVVAVVAGLVIIGTVFLILWNMQRPLSLAENVAKGRELSSLKRYSEAERYWRAAIDQDSYNPEYHNALGVALFFQKRYPESEGYLRKALSYNQGNAQYFADLGNALNSQAKYAEAEPEHRKAVDLDPKTGFMNMLGLDLFFQKKYAEAEEWFRKALATNADQAEIQNNLGNALYFQKNYKEARQHYEKARSLQPENTYFQENVKKSILRIEQPDLAP